MTYRPHPPGGGVTPGQCARSAGHHVARTGTDVSAKGRVQPRLGMLACRGEQSARCDAAVWTLPDEATA